MAAVLSGLSGVPVFNVLGTDRSSLSQRWQKWLSSFELFVLASGISDDKQQRALLLHCGGGEIQDIFSTLSNTGDT